MTELANDPRFAKNIDRVQHRAELEGILEKTILGQSREPLLKALEEAGVPATPVNTVDQVMNDPQTAARGMVDRVQHPVLGEIPVISTPVKFSNMKVGVRTPAPLRGQHTDGILGSLGYAPDAIAALRARKVVA